MINGIEGYFFSSFGRIVLIESLSLSLPPHAQAPFSTAEFVNSWALMASLCPRFEDLSADKRIQEINYPVSLDSS